MSSSTGSGETSHGLAANDIAGEHVVHRPDDSRYEIIVDATLAGYVDYDLGDGVITFTHTVTDPAMRGRGLARRLVTRALDDADAADLLVVPRCWYVAKIIGERRKDLLG